MNSIRVHLGLSDRVILALHAVFSAIHLAESLCFDENGGTFIVPPRFDLLLGSSVVLPYVWRLSAIR